MRQPEPTVVMPPPPTVPREMVTYSRMVLSAPMVAAGGFAGVLQVLRRDAEAGEGMSGLPGPSVRWPSRTTWEIRSQSLAEDDIGADGAARADGAGRGNVRASGDDRGGMDVGGGAHSARLRRVGRGGSGLGLAAVGERAHDGGFAGDLALDGGDARMLTALVRQLSTVDFDAELVAGNDGTAEAGVVDAGEDRQFGGAVRESR